MRSPVVSIRSDTLLGRAEARTPGVRYLHEHE